MKTHNWTMQRRRRSLESGHSRSQRLSIIDSVGPMNNYRLAVRLQWQWQLQLHTVSRVSKESAREEKLRGGM